MRDFDMSFHELNGHCGEPLYITTYQRSIPTKFKTNCRIGALILLSGGFVAAGVVISGIGLQNHDKMDWPTTEQLEATIEKFASMNLKVMITELDVDVLPPVAPPGSADLAVKIALREDLNPYAKGLPDSMQEALARRYAELFGVFLKHRDKITRVTFWGVTDGDSWLNNWPVKGRCSHPLLFGRDGTPKRAFDAIIRTTKQEQARAAAAN